MFGDPANTRARQRKRNLPVRSEFKGIGKKVLENLQQPLGVGGHAAGKIGVHRNGEAQIPRLGHMLEVSLDRIADAVKRHLFRLDGHGSRLDLGQIENIIDEVEQVGSRAMNGLRPFNLFWRQIMLGIVAELLAQNEDTVQRRAELVRHVGEELRLVFRGECKFSRLFLQRPASLFDFLVLTFDFRILLG